MRRDDGLRKGGNTARFLVLRKKACETERSPLSPSKPLLYDFLTSVRDAVVRNVFHLIFQMEFHLLQFCFF